MDVKTAFLNGNLIEDVYMTQLKGFAHSENSGKVCKLQRSIYGLSKLLKVGIFILMKQSMSLDSSRMKMNLVFIRKLVGVQ